MGEIADYMLEREFDRWYGDEEGGADVAVKCKWCGKTCTWHHTGVRWSLLDPLGRLHDCKPKPAAVDDFPLMDWDPNDPAQGLG